MQNKQNINSSDTSKEEVKPETITELAHRHLMDESHTTSDEELRNAKVEFSEEAETTEGNLFEVDHTTITGETENKETVAEDDDDKDKHNDPPNPYTILNP